MAADLLKLQKDWDTLGKQDPLYAISTVKGKEGGKWDIQDFFQRGVDEIESIMNQKDLLNLKISYTRALDFGCGVGRVTQSLAKYFDHIDGVDISPSMIELANTYNKFGDKITYHINNENSLKIFNDNTYDFIYSTEVLQHMHPMYQENFLKEFLRVLSPKGLLVFQLPSEPSTLNKKIMMCFQKGNLFSKMYWKLRNRPVMALMEYYCNPRKNVEQFLLKNGAQHVHAMRDARTAVISYNYFVTKY